MVTAQLQTPIPRVELLSFALRRDYPATSALRAGTRRGYQGANASRDSLARTQPPLWAREPCRARARTRPPEGPGGTLHTHTIAAPSGPNQRAAHMRIRDQRRAQETRHTRATSGLRRHATPCSVTATSGPRRHASHVLKAATSGPSRRVSHVRRRGHQWAIISSADEGDGRRRQLAMASAQPCLLQFDSAVYRAREPASVARHQAQRLIIPYSSDTESRRFLRFASASARACQGRSRASWPSGGGGLRVARGPRW